MVSENLRVVISKKMMKEGLLRCLKKRSLDKLSISELCRESQVNRATFYNHYSSPKEILAEICWDFAKQIEQIAKDNQKTDTRERLTNCLTYVYDNRDVLLTLLNTNVGEEALKANLEAMAYALYQLMDIRSMADLDAEEYELAKTYYSCAVLQTIQKWLRKDVNKTPREFAEFLMKLPTREVYR